MAIVHHFLLVYDHKNQRLVSKRQFTNGPMAASAYATCEAEHRNESDLEIVLVGADSLRTIMRTHGHYFRSAEEPFPSLLLPA